VSIAALGLVRMALAGAAAADLDDSSLRGSLSNVFSSTGYSRWDGVNFGVHAGVANMDTDFGNSTGPKVAYILRNTTVEKEYSPSSWTTLSSNVTSGRSYGAFLGYNVQWDQFVVGFDAAYNRVSGMETSASDSIGRQFKTSDGFYNDVTVSGQSTIKLLDYASLRGRAGYAFDQFLPYAVLGGAVGRFNYTNSATVKASGTDASGGGGCQELAEHRETCLDRAADPAFLLDHEHGRSLDLAGPPQVLALDESPRLGDLTAEAHDDVSGDVRMPRESRQDTLELQVLRPVRRHGASALVRECEHAVHRRVCGQLVSSDSVRDATAYRCRAVGHTDDGHVVAGTHAPVGAHIAGEVSLAGAQVRGSRRWISGGRERVRPIERADSAVVAVHVAPRLNVPRRDANPLAVLPDRRADWYLQEADLVPRGDRLEHGELAIAEADLIPGREWHHGHCDVVLGGEAYDGARRGHGPTRTAKGRRILGRRSTSDAMGRS